MRASTLSLQLLLSLAQAVELPPPANNLHAAKIPADVLSRPEVQPLVPPTSTRAGGVKASGTDVYMQLRIVKLLSVSTVTGTMQLRAWVRMKWEDSRLAWDASAYGGVDEIYVNGEPYAGAEMGEVWVPDITPYNGDGLAVSS